MYATKAEFYDELYVDQHDSGDLTFYLSEAKAAGGPVLGAACGTGRILLPTLAEGVDIDGFDREPAMLARLRGRGTTAADLDQRGWEAGMREVTAPRQYALVTCP